MTLSKNNVKRANRLSQNAVSLFQNAHDDLLEANDLLHKQIDEDQALVKLLQEDINTHTATVFTNENLIMNLKQFIA